MLRNQYRFLQHGDVIFIDETNIFFILLTIILQASDPHARAIDINLRNTTM